jgi:hypothetical protein
MQRLACLFLMISAACTSGTSTGTATLSNTSVKAAASEPFVGPDAAGNQVMGWTILLYEQEAGGDCLEGTVLAKIGIYTNQVSGSAPQAILPLGGVSIVTDSPPMLVSMTAANMSAEGVGAIQGLVSVSEFHLTADAVTADRIAGTISAGGYDSAEASVALTGMFVAPICTEE